MSPEQTPVQDPVEVPDNSLAARMRAQREAIESITTEKFPLPHYPFVLVELRPIDYKREYSFTRRIAKKERDESNRDLYVAAETLLNATVGFWVDDNGTLKAVADHQNNWIAMCQNVYPEFSGTARQALIRLVNSDRLIRFYQRYEEWRDDRGIEVADELAQDLGGTRSRS